jgi:hypothetical protein
MSWKTINRILGLAAVDQHFWQALQKDPLTAIQEQGFELNLEEQAILNQIAVESLPEFSQRLLDVLAPDAQ